MQELQVLRADHAPAVLSFELANQAYFARWITDRGEEFFTHFDERFAALLADQRAGAGAYHVLAGDDGSIAGRFNLIFLAEGVAELGYRVAEASAGRGVATRAVRELCELAAQRYGVRRFVAATSTQNVASQKVLTSNAFHHVGPADPADLRGKPGYRYERMLS
ncbi:MAG TPA: GNAT family protein [Frankiaceae bacterium]|nr:GNAT family protein [Frankiaceae bacterium]